MPMVSHTQLTLNLIWRVILRAEQIVWHNKELPATFTPPKD